MRETATAGRHLKQGSDDRRPVAVCCHQTPNDARWPGKRQRMLGCAAMRTVSFGSGLCHLLALRAAVSRCPRTYSGRCPGYPDDRCNRRFSMDDYGLAVSAGWFGLTCSIRAVDGPPRLRRRPWLVRPTAVSRVRRTWFMPLCLAPAGTYRASSGVHESRQEISCAAQRVQASEAVAHVAAGAHGPWGEKRNRRGSA